MAETGWGTDLPEWPRSTPKRGWDIPATTAWDKMAETAWGTPMPEWPKPRSEYSLPGEYPDEWEAENSEPPPYIDLTHVTYPKHTSNRARPRTMAAGYDKETQTLRIQFRSPSWTSRHRADDGNGAVYDYHGVTPAEWRDIRRVLSTGKFINRRLAGKDYTRVDT